MQKDFSKIATDEVIQKTIDALIANGMDAEVVNTGEEAKEKVLGLIPEGAEVFTLTSETTRTIGLAEALDTSGKYKSVRQELEKMDRTTQSAEMQKLGAAPEYAVASVHAVTEDGHVYIASNTGSQLPADVYGAAHVVWVVGAQKIVSNHEEAMKRLYDYILPQESVRLRAAYNLPETVSSFVSKLLIINREVAKDRIKIIFVKEQLGF